MTNFEDVFGAEPQEYLLKFNEFLSERGLPAMPCPLVAIDDGYNQVNAAFWRLEEDGSFSIGQRKIKSRGKRGRHLQTFGGEGVGIYSSGDDEYTISPNLAEPEDTRTDDYAKTPLNRFLVHAILNSMGITNGMEVALVTGLPVGHYLRDGTGVNTKLVEAKKKNMLVPVVVGIDKSPSARVVRHGVLPEAISGIVDWVIGDNGQAARDPSIPRMAIDIGGNTTDLAVIFNTQEVAETITVKYGVSHMRDKLRMLVEDKLDFVADSMTIDEVLDTKKAHVFGTEESFEDEWVQATNDVLKNIYQELKALNRKYPSIKELVGFGGGVELCKSVIRSEFSQIQTMDNSDGSNAVGALKFSTFGEIEKIVSEIMEGRKEAAEA